MEERWATFDCYGTLVDWTGGIRDTVSGLWPDRDAERLVGRYHEIEPEIQRGRGIPYREVMAESLERLAREERLPPRHDDRDALARSLPGWRVFPEVPGALATLRSRGWRLAILSNTDPDLLAASIASIGVPVDERVVASEIGSYKPAFGHWDVFFRRTGATRARHIHVAASAFHDLEPCAALGLPCVWINRDRSTSDVPRAGELPDLSGLPDLLEGLVPPEDRPEDQPENQGG